MSPTAKIFLMTSLTMMVFTTPHSKAVVNLPYPSGTAYYNTTDTISNSVPGWSSGWGAGDMNDGWNYIGQVNRSSGVYLGNGWVLTAGHVGVGNFTLAGNTYDTTGFVYTDFPTTINGSNYNADLSLFQISTLANNGFTLNLPILILASNSPTYFYNFTQSKNLSQSQVVMIGYGGGQGESWGVNNTTAISQGVAVDSYGTIDFLTLYGSETNVRSVSITNTAVLVGGDSGGGDFMSVGNQWQLAGINEAVDTSNASYMVQLSAYSATIKSVMASVPEPFDVTLITLGGFLILVTFFKRRHST
jgi:hypothetical protein